MHTVDAASSLPNFDGDDATHGGKQPGSVDFRVVIVFGVDRLNAFDVIGRVEEQMVIDGHSL